jgi:AraC-like DNA-binding protein
MLAKSSAGALDAALRSLKVACSFQVVGDLRAPWGVAIPGEGMSAFHYVGEGRCVLQVEGGEGLALAEGDFVWMPAGLPRMLADRPGRRAEPLRDHVRIGHGGETARLSLGGRGARCLLLGAGVRLDGGRWETWRCELPRLLVWKAEGAMASLLGALTGEAAAPGPGSAVVSARMVELISVMALRRELGLSAHAPGPWLRAIRDRHLGPALARMHAEPGRPWTVESLGRIAGLGRSAFAARFSAELGQSPAAYLTSLRLERARRRLRESDRTLDEIALEVGYGSAASLAHSFKKHFGETPGTLRRTGR